MNEPPTLCQRGGRRRLNGEISHGGGARPLAASAREGSAQLVTELRHELAELRVKPPQAPDGAGLVPVAAATEADLYFGIGSIKRSRTG